MISRSLALAFLATISPVLLASRPCAAQSATDDPTTLLARARFKEGVEFFDKGQFELARAAFLQAYALKKHPAVLLNLAWSCQKSGHAMEAVRYFKEVLADGKEITDKQRADANDGLTQAQAKLGRIEIVAARGTDVNVDGNALGSTPIEEPILVDPGTHVVKMRGPEGADSLTVTVAAGEHAIAKSSRLPAPVPPLPAPPLPPAEVPQSAAPAPAPPPPTTTPVVSPPAELPTSPPEPYRETPAMSVVPLIVGGVLTGAGAVVAVVMLVAKNAAQGKANTSGQEISVYESAHGLPQTCATTAATPAIVVAACGTWNGDNSAVNQDATVGNIAVGVGIAAAVGTIAYGAVYALSSGAHPSSRWTLTPNVGKSSGGLSLSLDF
ncbi:MAG: tetratricopeptide repeat protein [Polyangiaceae bacterium]|jgi:hypothetical protein